GDLIFRLQLDALVDGAVVVETGQHVRLAKLPVVKQIARNLVVDVDSDLQARGYLLSYADIEVMRTLGQHGTCAGYRVRRGAGRRLLDVESTIEQGKIGRA